MKFICIAICLTTAFFYSGCVTTEVNDFTDPEYITFTSKKFLVITPNTAFDNILLRTLKSKNIDAEAHVFSDLFLRTRQYSKDKITEVIKANGYDSIISITIAGDDESSKVISYFTSSSAQAYSASYNSAYATGYSTTIPITAYNKNTTAIAELLDPILDRKIWIADIETKASGSAYMHDKYTMRSISEKVVTTLILKGHLKTKQNI